MPLFDLRHRIPSAGASCLKYAAAALRANRTAGQPRSTFRVVYDASLEVRSAVVYATLIVAFVCLPIFFMGGE